MNPDAITFRSEMQRLGIDPNSSLWLKLMDAATENRMLRDSIEYYAAAFRSTMPRSWEHISTTARHAFQHGRYEGIAQPEVTEALSVLASLAAMENHVREYSDRRDSKVRIDRDELERVLSSTRGTEEPKRITFEITETKTISVRNTPDNIRAFEAGGWHRVSTEGTTGVSRRKRGSR